MVELHTLGDAAITVGRRKIRPSSPLVFAALLYLATERGRRVPRAALQEMLFPETDERSGAHSLRQLLYKLRQFGVPLEADASGVLLPADQVRDDTAEDAAEHGAAPDLTAPFLPDYHPGLSERFTEWLDRRRDRWAGDFRKRLVAVIESRREALDWPAVERHARALLSVDPYNEVGTLALAMSIALSGGKAAAIRMLLEYERETGRKDLQLPAALLRRRISETVPEQRPPLGQTPFVGREAEVVELRRQIAAARQGRASLYVLGGDPGIGKSRLLTEVSGLAALEDMRVFTVRCQSHYATRPMSVFIELVPALRVAPGALGIAPTSVAMLNLLTSHADSPTERASDARDDITRSELLLTAIRDLVDAVAGEQPLLVGVEDAHWADRDSLRELNRLVQGVTDRPLMVICTTRTPETFPCATTDDRTAMRRLKPLEPRSMEELAEHLLPSNGKLPRGDLVSWSVRTSGGNPLFLQMLCGHYVATGEAFAVPPDMSAAVMRRVQQLPEHSRPALAFVALLGKHATLHTVRALAGWDHVRLFEAVQRLEEEHYIYQSDDTIRISHDLLSECVLALIPPLSRKVMHSSVAAALESRYDQTGDASLMWDCAEHWVQSGQTDKAIQFLIRCAEHASSLGRAGEALALLARAEQLTNYPAQLSDVLSAAILAARSAGDWEQLQTFSGRLGKITPRRGPQHSPSELAALETPWLLRFEGRQTAARLSQCIGAKNASAEHKIDAAHLLIRIAHEMGQSSLAHDIYQTIEPLLERAEGPYSSRTLQTMYHVCFGDQACGERILRDVVADLPHFESVFDEIRGAISCATQMTHLCLYDEALRLTAQYFEKCDELGLRTWKAECAALTTAIYCVKDDFVSAHSWIEKTDELIAGAGVRMHPASLAAHRVEVAIARGDISEATRWVSVLEQFPLGDSLRGRGFVKACNVRTLQLNPDFKADDATLEQLRSLQAATRSLFGADAITVALAEELVRRNQIQAACAILTEYLQLHRRERVLGTGPLRAMLERTQQLSASGGLLSF